MHPEITKFWEKFGKIENDTMPSAPVSYLYWVIYPDGEDTPYTAIYLAFRPSDSNKITYFLNGATYDEATCLRLIKQKAFL